MSKSTCGSRSSLLITASSQARNIRGYFNGLSSPSATEETMIRTSSPMRNLRGREGETSFPDPLDNDAVPCEAPVVVIGGAGALRGDHARPDRVLGSARGAEHLALPWLDDALEDLAALACLRVRDAHSGDREAALRVEVRVGLADREGALGDEAEPAPLEVRPQHEHLGEHLERAQVALLRDDALVLVL